MSFPMTYPSTLLIIQEVWIFKQTTHLDLTFLRTCKKYFFGWRMKGKQSGYQIQQRNGRYMNKPYTYTLWIIENCIYAFAIELKNMDVSTASIQTNINIAFLSL